jgi:hypothetical protein
MIVEEIHSTLVFIINKYYFLADFHAPMLLLLVMG